MASEARATHSVLRRKTHAARPVSAPEPPTKARACKALRRALARAGQSELSLSVEVLEIELREEVSLAELLDMPEDGSLLCILEGPGDALGLFALAPGVLDGIVQHQTTGSLLPGEVALRRPTRTDAAMAAGTIDRAMAELETDLSGTFGLGWAAGYRYASFLDQPRALGLLLEDLSYRVFEVALDLSGGAKQGGMLLGLPRVEPEPVDPVSAPGGAGGVVAPALDAAGTWEVAFREAVLESRADLDAVLTRIKVPLGAVLRWKPGELIALSQAELEGITLEARTGSARHRRFAGGRLGQFRGSRAVRIDDGAEPPAPVARHSGIPSDRPHAQVGKLEPASEPEPAASEPAAGEILAIGELPTLPGAFEPDDTQSA